METITEDSYNFNNINFDLKADIFTQFINQDIEMMFKVFSEP